jgi:multiple sugar transport system ATP-binding protein
LVASRAGRQRVECKPMAQVILENVTKVFPGGVQAVDNMSLHIADQEFIVLVGPSGCGKSTTLRMVAGLEEITSGTIQIGDRVVNDVPPKNRDIAMVFQNYALYPHMSVYKNMAFGLKLRKVPKKEIDEKVRAAAHMLGIEELLDRKPKALSGGQRQRVAVGRAIVRNPKAFLFDEPLSNLDAKLRVEMRAEIKKLHRRLQTTTIYVTHDQEEAMTLGDRVVVMRDGLVQQVDSPLNIYDYPVNRFVGGFVGTPPMNFLHGKLVASNGAIYFDTGDDKVRLQEETVRRISGKVGEPVVFGIRPECMSNHGDGDFAGTENVLNVRVSVVEPLGDKMDVYMSTPHHEHLVCRADAHARIQEGQTLPIYLDMSRVHIFEPGETGVNISLSGNGASSSA